MKKRLIISLLLAVVFVIGGCATRPPAVDPTTTEVIDTEVPTTEVTDAEVTTTEVTTTEVPATEVTTTGFPATSEKVPNNPGTVTVKGNFAVHVIDIFPDYVFDDVTPKILYVACFQAKPFLLEVPDSFLANISKGKNYLFTIEEKVLQAEELKMYQAGGERLQYLPLEVLIPLFDLSFESVEEVGALGMGVADNWITFEPKQ